MKKYLTKDKRDKLLSEMSNSQIEYINNRFKNKRKSSFSNILASRKGANSSEFAEEIASKWMLVDFIDNGKVMLESKCLCGRPLRYVYVVQNMLTGEHISLGITHLQEHTNIPPEIVKDIIKHMHLIDNELDDFLIAYENGNYMNLTNPSEVTFTKDISNLLSLNLPLSSKQFFEYMKMMKGYEVELRKREIEQEKALLKQEGIKRFSEKTGMTLSQVKGITQHLKTDKFIEELDELHQKLEMGTNVDDQIFIPSDFDFEIVPNEIKVMIDNGLPLLDRQLTILSHQIHLFEGKRSYQEFERDLKTYFYILTQQFNFSREVTISILGELRPLHYRATWREWLNSFNDSSLKTDDLSYKLIYAEVQEILHDAHIAAFYKNNLVFTPAMRTKINTSFDAKKSLEKKDTISIYEQVINQSPDIYLTAFILDLVRERKKISNLEMRRLISKKQLNIQHFDKVMSYLERKKILRITQSYGLVKEYALSARS